MNEIKLYKNNEIIAKVENVIYVFRYGDGTLSIKDKDNIEHVYVKEDYDIFFVM